MNTRSNPPRAARIAAALFLVAGAAAAAPEAAPAAEVPPGAAADLLPPGLAAIVVVRDGDRLLEGLRSFLEARDYQQSPLYRTAAAQPGFARLGVGILGLASAAKTDPWAGAAALLGRDLALGIAPRGKGKQPRLIAAAVPRDPGAVERILEAVHQVAGIQPGIEPEGESAAILQVAPGLIECRLRGALIVSNSRDLVRRAIAGAGRRERPRLAKAAAGAVRAGSVTGFVDVAVLRRAALEQGRDLAAGRLPDPLGGMLLGGWWQEIVRADLAAARIVPGRRHLALEVSVKRDAMTAGGGQPGVHPGFLPQEGPAGPSFAGIPRFLGELRVTRAWADLLADRETLFTLPAAGKIDAFAGVLTTLLGGLDFVDELLPRIAGPVRLVAARRAARPGGPRPTPSLPAFALVAPLDLEGSQDGLGGGDALRRRLESGALMALALIDFDAARKGGPPFLIDMEKHSGFRMIRAAYPGPEQGTQESGGPAGIRYNFEPAVSLARGRLVVGTTVDLVRDLIDALDAPPEAGTSGDRLLLRAPALAALLEENREEIVAARMLKEGESRREAETFLGALLSVADLVQGVEVVSRCEGGAGAGIEARVDIAFRPAHARRRERRL